MKILKIHLFQYQIHYTYNLCRQSFIIKYYLLISLDNAITTLCKILDNAITTLCKMLFFLLKFHSQTFSTVRHLQGRQLFTLKKIINLIGFVYILFCKHLVLKIIKYSDVKILSNKLRHSEIYQNQRMRAKMELVCGIHNIIAL